LRGKNDRVMRSSITRRGRRRYDEKKGGGRVQKGSTSIMREGECEEAS